MFDSTFASWQLLVTWLAQSFCYSCKQFYFLCLCFYCTKCFWCYIIYTI